MNRKELYIALFTTVLLVLPWGYSHPVCAATPTQVFVDPSSQTVLAQETFTVAIACTPGQPIKSFELQVTFNPSVLHATSVTEGTIFSGHTTFFNAGLIDNTAGKIINVYNLIVGPSNVTEPGTFVTISFTALSYGGTSTIDLSMVGVTNETGYVPLSVTDGSVLIIGGNQPPMFSSENPGNGWNNITVDHTSLSVDIHDAEGDLFDWSITTSPDIGSATGADASNGTKACTISNLEYLTTYQWTVSTKSTESGIWNNMTYAFTTVAQTQGSPPGSPDPPGQGGDPPATPQNTAPQSPAQPTGLVELTQGIQYTYASSTYDPDGNLTRLRFDWGDGQYSNWSEFVSSNTTVSFAHAWSTCSSFSIRVLAQDEEGLNSSWSTPLNVTVIGNQTHQGNESLELTISAPDTAPANSSVLFDASGTNDPQVTILSYTWDFGDGTTGTGISLTHTYAQPGVYTVVLTVIDTGGTTHQTTFTITVEGATQTSGSQDAFPILYLIIAGTLSLLIIGLILGRHRLRDTLEEVLTRNRIVRLNAKMQKLATTTATEPSSVAPPYPGDPPEHLAVDETPIEEKIDDVLNKKFMKY
ncbi:MAG: PKD domain-containing protein [Candidatus Thermoplasmatota archaeon]|nr:PKD domain-containing protein [Candidatus Thermoplasmatota archaeon]